LTPDQRNSSDGVENFQKKRFVLPRSIFRNCGAKKNVLTIVGRDITKVFTEVPVIQILEKVGSEGKVRRIVGQQEVVDRKRELRKQCYGPNKCRSEGATT